VERIMEDTDTYKVQIQTPDTIQTLTRRH
jgi:hypothetical protein